MFGYVKEEFDKLKGIEMDIRRGRVEDNPGKNFPCIVE